MKKIKLKILFIYILILFKISKIKKISPNNQIISNKWIVMSVYHSPDSKFIELLKNVISWKIVIIGNNPVNDIKWKQLENKNNLIYLSLKDQLNLGYEIIKYIDYNSNSRKNIGYLYAIQHGATEIYEIDEGIIISDLKYLDNGFKNTLISYFLNNQSKMVNPFDYFGEKYIWPRGFRIQDIAKNDNNKYFILNSSKLEIEPLIFQGLINGIPDVDSIFMQTRIDKINVININISNNYPLLYLPGNYIPINSKNTKYLYNIFPYLLIPNSINERISDIFRGYIMQRCAWSQNGAVIYFSNSIYQYKLEYSNELNFIKDKQIFYNLDNLLNELNKKIKLEDNNPIEFFFQIIKNLVNQGFLKQNNLELYESFIKDLLNIGYNFTSDFLQEINFNNERFFKINTQYNYYLPSNPNIFLINHYHYNSSFIQILRHFTIKRKYTDVLLIINYNYAKLQILNDYMLKLYNTYFPNIVFLTPYPIIENDKIISCNESFDGYYSYYCFKKVYEKYSKFKGYLYINDDLFVKIWELDNLDFNIPWFYMFYKLSRSYSKWPHYNECSNIYGIINNNSQWKNNLVKFLGFYDIPITLADFYYIPNYIASKFVIILEKMFNSKIFLECAVPTAMAIILLNKYQIINIKALWNDERKNVIYYLKKAFNQITIHPIKFSNIYFQNEINKYIYFINNKEY